MSFVLLFCVSFWLLNEKNGKKLQNKNKHFKKIIKFNEMNEINVFFFFSQMKR